MSEATYGQNPRSCAYVASFGINPNRVPVDGWDGTGYDLIDGEGVFGDSRIPRSRNTWPAGFDYAQMLAHWAADAPTRRRKEVTTHAES